MAKLTYHAASSLDGFVACSDGNFECFAMQGPHVDDFLQTVGQYKVALMGRKTYEVGLRYGVTNPYPHLRTYVFSTTMQESPDPAIHLVRSDAVATVRRLKEETQDGEIWLVGAGSLAATLLAADLIDEITVKVNPLLIGKGVPLIEHLLAPRPLRLTNSKAYDNGIVLLSYSF